MLHVRRTLPHRSTAVLGSALVGLWDRMIASDPGLLRLLMATRGTISVFLMALVAVFLGRLLGAPTVELASGVTLSLMGPFLMREPTRRQRQQTLVLLALPAAAATVVTTLLHGRGVLGDCFFLVLVFGCFLLQGRGPRAIGQGLVAVVTSYVGLYLELPPRSLPTQLLSIAAAIPVTWFACFVLLPLRPAATLRRMVQAVQGRAALVLHDAAAPGEDRADDSRTTRLARGLARLNEAALAADDYLTLLDPGGSRPLRHQLMDLELAAARFAATTPELGGDRVSRRHATRLHVTARRLRRSRWSVRDLQESTVPPLPASAPAPASTALADLTRAAAALGDAATLPAVPSAATPPAPPGPLAWRIALRVTVASALAMAGGMTLSPNRWFWAVITVYVVFLNTRSRGDTAYKGVQRVGGTVIGLVGGVIFATLLKGDPVAENGVLLGAVFGMYYLYQISYTLGIFCVTVMLGLLYSLLGAAMEPLLVLRLEETAIGAAAAILVAVTVLPVRTREQVSQSGTAALRALVDAVASCRRALAGEGFSDASPATTPLAAMRALDRQVADLRLAMLPLIVGRLPLRRTEIERPVGVLLDCVHWTRMLAVAATGPDAAAAAQAATIERRLAGLVGVDHPSALEPLPALDPPDCDAPTAVQTALNQLDRATAALAERMAIGELHGFGLGG
jgi:uncharacterized membrane protein YccC